MARIPRPFGKLNLRRKPWIWAGAAALCLAVTALLGLGRGTKPAAATETSVATGIVPLTKDQAETLSFATVTQREFHEVTEADGKITTNNDQTVSVYSPYSGQVTQVLVEPGDHVTRGQPLFGIASTETAQAITDLETARTNLMVARSQESLADSAEKRAEAVYKSAGGALKDYEQAQHDLTVARGASEAAEAGLKSEVAKLSILGISPAAIGAIPKNGNAATFVRAPVSGVVSQRSIAAGQMIASPGALALVLTNTSSVWLEAQVSEVDAGRIKVGQTLSVHVSAYPERVFTAHILSVSPGLDPDTHRLPVRAQLDNADGILKPEMFASFEINGATLQTGLAVPAEAVIREGDMARVWVVDAHRTAHCRQVTLGLVNAGYAQILDGLKAGEQVVVKGGLFVDKAGLS